MSIKIPPLLYGTAWKELRTADLVEMAIVAGFRGIDTACQPKHYHEAGVGEALQRLAASGIKREELFVQTKFTPIGGHDPKRIPYNPNSPLEVQVADSFKRSQENLKTPYVDSLVLHSPLFPYDHLLRVWGAMEEIYRTGGALQLGISNCYDLELLKKLYGNSVIKPTIVQNRFYTESDYDVELRQWCDNHDIIYQSFWSLTANPHILKSDTVQQLSEKYTKTPAQIWYRYLSHVGIVPLIGSTSRHHLDEDLNIFTFELTLLEIQQLTVLLD